MGENVVYGGPVDWDNPTKNLGEACLVQNDKAKRAAFMVCVDGRIGFGEFPFPSPFPVDVRATPVTVPFIGTKDDLLTEHSCQSIPQLAYKLFGDKISIEGISLD